MARWILCIHGIAAIAIGFILVASAFGMSDLYRWTADVAAIPGARPYEGLLSNMGIIAWSSAFAVAFFTGVMTLTNGPREVPRLLVGGGLVTFVLLVDDLFMLHDTLLPEYLGVPEEIATALVGLVALAFLWIFKQQIPRTPWPLLAIGVAYLAIMTVFDFLEKRVDIPAHQAWEEGAKLLGVLHWCGYLVLTSVTVLAGRLAARPGERPASSGISGRGGGQ